MINDLGFIRIGNSDVNRIGLGTGAHYSSFTWGQQEKKESIAAIRTAIDFGISFIDTGETYGNGECERIIGESIQGNREKTFLATKISEAVLQTNDKQKIENSCDKSLRRLNVDYIDLYQIHWLNEKIDINIAIDSLMELKKKGKVLNLGICNCGKDYLSKFDDEFVSLQIPYSLIWRGMEYDYGNYLEKLKYVPVFYFCLGQGLLGMKYMDLFEFPNSRKRTRLFDYKILEAKHRECGNEKALSEFLKKFHALCNKYSVDESYAAISWILKRVKNSLALVGMRNKEQVKNFLEIEKISDELDFELSVISNNLKDQIGKQLDLWDSNERIR